MSPESPKESSDLEGKGDQVAKCCGEGAGQADEVSKDRGEQPMMYGDRAEIIVTIVLIALLVIIGAVIYEALTK